METIITHIPPDFTILTPRCRLRHVSQADMPNVFSATRFAGFNDGMTWEAPASVEELQEPYRRNLATWAEGTSFCFTIETREASCFIGRIRIGHDGRGVWSIGYWTHPQQQGRGYMTEGARAVVGFGFRATEPPEDRGYPCGLEHCQRQSTR